MNAIYSTKDRECLIIEENFLDNSAKFLAFKFDSTNGNLQIILTQEGQENQYFDIDSLKAQKSMAAYLSEKYNEALQLTSDEKSLPPLNPKVNDRLVQDMLSQAQKGGKQVLSHRVYC